MFQSFFLPFVDRFKIYFLFLFLFNFLFIFFWFFLFQFLRFVFPFLYIRPVYIILYSLCLLYFCFLFFFYFSRSSFLLFFNYPLDPGFFPLLFNLLPNCSLSFFPPYSCSFIHVFQMLVSRRPIFRVTSCNCLLCMLFNFLFSLDDLHSVLLLFFLLYCFFG